MIFVSTTYYKKERSRLIEPFTQLLKLPIDGIEVGSTHLYEEKKKLKKIIQNSNNKRIFLHNFFPPIKNKNFVINISSEDKKIRNKSVEMIINNMNFSKAVNAELYTFHPGFLSLPQPKTDFKNSNYDFDFSKKKYNYSKSFNNMLNSLKKITNYAKSKKIKVAIETEGSVLKKNFLLMQKPSEFKKLFKFIPENLFINLNIAHTRLAAKAFKFKFSDFLKATKDKIVAVELSCNDGENDQHLPINASSQNLKYLKFFKNIPIILEYRNTSLNSLRKSIKIIKKIKKKYD